MAGSNNEHKLLCIGFIAIGGNGDNDNLFGGSSSYLIGLKPVIRLKICEFLPGNMKKIILCELSYNPH